MKIEQLHEEQLRQLTGCRYATLRALHVALQASAPVYCENFPAEPRSGGRAIYETRLA